MKKIFINLLVYTFLASLASFLIGAFLFKVPVLNMSDIMHYRFNNGFLFMFEVMPSAVVTGFLVGCAVSFGDVEASAYARFSSSLVTCFRDVIIIVVFATFGLSFCHDVFIPALQQKKIEYEQKPETIRNYKLLAENYMERKEEKTEYAKLAFFYFKKIIELDPSNKEAAVRAKEAELAAASGLEKTNSEKKDSAVTSDLSLIGEAEPIDYTEIDKMKASSVHELVLEAEKLFDAKDYLGAHYYAQAAIKIADEKDINLADAKSIANEAWNILSETIAEEPTEENMFFRKKVEGYKKLNSNDILGAYYIFQSLNTKKIEYGRDPDVKRYLNDARDRLSKEYFFTDETIDKDAFESAKNVYFALKHKDSSYDIFYIKGITDINNTGKLVRYLREVHIYSFDQYGDFVKAASVPYAKMLACDIKQVMGEKEIEEKGIDAKWKTVPRLLLCSVDRDVEGLRLSPSYVDKNYETVEGPNQMLLAMPYNDFTVLSQCADGNHKMNFWTMSKMKLSASSYGYSDEIIIQTVLSSVFYPFMIFIILILCASIGWNYRLIRGTMFKFVWVFIIPLFNVIMYGAIGFMEFLVKLLNFIFMGIAGTTFALYLGIVFYLFWVFIVGFLFLSRKGD